MEDFDYLNGLKALSDIFESAAEIENADVVATKNNIESVSSESKHYGILSSRKPGKNVILIQKLCKKLFSHLKNAAGKL